MARATNKKDLIDSANQKFDTLIHLLDELSIELIQKPFSFDISNKKEAHWHRDKNIRDTLIHLHEWHNLLIDWINSNLNGEKNPFIPLPFNWKTYGELNLIFWKKHQETSYEDAITLLMHSNHEVMMLLDNFSEEALFIKNYFKWTGTTTLGSYCISSTTSHYEWAINKIKSHVKS